MGALQNRSKQKLCQTTLIANSISGSMIEVVGIVYNAHVGSHALLVSLIATLRDDDWVRHRTVYPFVAST